MINTKNVWQEWIPSQERISKPEYIAAAEQAQKDIGLQSKMISGSKSGYMKRNKKSLAVFNANICTESLGKIWFGDLDLSKEEKNLKQLAKNINQTIYILSEHSARFNNENNPQFNEAILIITPDGESALSQEYSEKFTRLKNGKIVRKEVKV